MDEKKKDFGENRSFDAKRGVTINWDNKGNLFVSMSVNSIPDKQFDSWMEKCRKDFSSKRWDMIMSDHIKAKAYDALLMTIPQDEEFPETKNINELGLLNGGV